ncbi:MAG: S-methyl-5-thioribose-1-phosphate isomerase [Candidatus Magnetomorum sp.]|nr:S-methyl-5-thioribose-1-phosphate isomerase [Candidatus Magnetomorum sp.]
MNVDGQSYRPIWLDPENETAVNIIDQRLLPHEFVIESMHTLNDIIRAIKEMYVRGAPLIGVTAAYGVYLILVNAKKTGDRNHLIKECKRLKAARPTAVNLAWAVDTMLSDILSESDAKKHVHMAREKASQIAEAEVDRCYQIGIHGARLIAEIAKKKKQTPVNVLTHCNAGWLACVEYGTATAPIYVAHDQGLNVHVWVDETRPLNQGARLTAWELGKHGVDHTVIPDNTGGHLMQHRQVDLVIVGTDRTTYTGDVANKIGTYLKALAAKDNNIPFYVALPSSTFDWTVKDGVKDIPIEKRDPDEIRWVQGHYQGKTCSVLVPPENSPCANYAFDVTPSRLVTGLITERGICEPSEHAILAMFSDRRP